MNGMRNGMGQKGQAVVADPGAVGVLGTGQVGKRRRGKAPKNIKGLPRMKSKKRK